MQKHANHVEAPEDEPDLDLDLPSSGDEFEIAEAVANKGGSGNELDTACARCARRVAGNPAKYRLHRCAFPAGAGNRCAWCVKNNKTCEKVSLPAQPRGRC